MGVVMHTIEIDFDVFKKLTVMRETESVTYNDVIRRLLDMQSGSQPSVDESKPKHGFQFESPMSTDAWTTKGVTFPAGTEFRANYKGQTVLGRVEAGSLVVNGKRYDSPSAAAVAVTGNSVNGWIFWECKRPGNTSWQLITSLRKGLRSPD